MRKFPAVRAYAKVENLERRQLLSAVTGFTLINSQTDQPVPGFNSIDNGDTINLANLPAGKLNVRANTDNLGVKSVKLGLDNNANFAIENVSPYALFGNTGNDFNDGTFAVGTHTLKGTPFSLSGAKGTAGTSRTVTFNVINQPTTPPPPVPAPQVTQFLLIDADTDQVIEPIDAGDEFNLATLPTRNLNIEVKTSGQAGSVRIKLDDVQKVENFSPWAYFGNTGNDFNAGLLSVGGHTLTATAFVRTGAGGQAGAANTVQFKVVDKDDTPPGDGPVINGFELANRFGIVISPLTTGATIDLGADSLVFRDLNILADVDDTVGSIAWRVDGGTYVVVNNPNEIFGLDEETLEEDVFALFDVDHPVVGRPLFTEGVHTVQATPFSGLNGTGDVGQPLSVRFTVTDSDQIDGLRFFIDLDADGSLFDESALGDQGNEVIPQTADLHVARFVNAGDEPLLLDGELSFEVFDFFPAQDDPTLFPTMALFFASGRSANETPAGATDVRVTRFFGEQIQVLETAQRRPAEDPNDPPVFLLTYEFFDVVGAEGPNKTLEPGESFDFAIDTQLNGSLRSGSGQPSKKGKPKRF